MHTALAGIALGALSLMGASLHVDVENIRSEKGIVRVGVYAEGGAFPETDASDFQGVFHPARGERGVRIEGLPSGTYAVAVYHDLDEDGGLDTSFFGIPTEPYGFSNNPASGFGAPAFSACAFVLEGERRVSVRLSD